MGPSLRRANYCTNLITNYIAEAIRLLIEHNPMSRKLAEWLITYICAAERVTSHLGLHHILKNLQLLFNGEISFI